MKFKPLNDRILVKRLDPEEKTAGGLYIPDTAQEKPIQGVVVACGEGKTLDNGQLRPLEVQVGQTVFFRKYAGSEVTLSGVEHMIMREEEVLAVQG